MIAEDLFAYSPSVSHCSRTTASHDESAVSDFFVLVLALLQIVTYDSGPFLMAGGCQCFCILEIFSSVA